jgi:hypothetical protein
MWVAAISRESTAMLGMPPSRSILRFWLGPEIDAPAQGQQVVSRPLRPPSSPRPRPLDRQHVCVSRRGAVYQRSNETSFVRIFRPIMFHLPGWSSSVAVPDRTRKTHDRGDRSCTGPRSRRATVARSAKPTSRQGTRARRPMAVEPPESDTAADTPSVRSLSCPRVIDP